MHEVVMSTHHTQCHDVGRYPSGVGWNHGTEGAGGVGMVHAHIVASPLVCLDINHFVHVARPLVVS